MIGYRTTFPRVEVIKLEQENNGVNSAAIVKGIRERAQPLPFGNHTITNATLKKNNHNPLL